MNDFYRNLVTAVATFIAGGIFSLLLARIARIVLGRVTARTKSETDDYILNQVVKAIGPLGWIISGSISWKLLEIDNVIDNVFMGITKIFCLFLLVRLVNKVVIKLIDRWSLRINDSSFSTMLRSLGPMVRALVWSIGCIFYLQNMGVQMAAIWALLSAGGIGAGLALKEPVQEFFEYITILLDKPFQNGQFIHINNVWATVERVGVRSTRLRSVNGEVIIMSNSALTSGVIANYAEMDYRRIIHKIGVTYDTNLPNLKIIPDLIKSCVDQTKDAVFDRCHFIKFGDFSLDFEFVYYIPTNDYLRAMSAQENVNLAIMSAFKSEGIEFAFPTQTLYVSKE